jgi:hypothetical protein
MSITLPYPQNSNQNQMRKKGYAVRSFSFEIKDSLHA